MFIPSRVAISRGFVASLFLAICSTGSAANHLNWSLRAWQSDEGLPDNAVVGIGQTVDGFLWVATQAGLVRFDGTQFHEFPRMTAAGRMTGLMRGLTVDHHNRLWVAKDVTVLAYMDHGSVVSFTPNDGLPVARAKSIVTDKQDNLWVAYSGRQVVRVTNGRLHTFTQSDGLPGNDDCQLACDKDGALWYCSGGNIGFLKGERFNVFKTVPGLQCIAAARSGGIWLCNTKEIYRCSPESGLVEVASFAAHPRAGTPSVLYEDRAGALWIGTREAGLLRYDGTAFQHIPTSHHEILCITEGREGTIWVGTMGGGLNRLRPEIVGLRSIGVGASFDGLRSVCEDAGGTKWAVDRNGAIARDAGDGWRALSTNEGWTIPNATTLAPEPKGGVWIGTHRNGLHLWRDGRVVLSLSTSDGIAGNVIRSLLTTASGDVWIATTAESLQRWREGRLESFKLPEGCGAVRALAVDGSGTVWAGTASGTLLSVRNERVQNETPAEARLSQAIRCLHAASDGALWIGYSGAGAGMLRHGRFSLFRAAQGLNDEYISQILEDSKGRVWFAGNKGIFYARRDALEAVASGRAERVQSIVFGHEEGLPALQTSWEFWPCAMRGRDGRFYVAMRTGLAVINPDVLEPDVAPPLVLLETVSIDGVEVAAYDPPVLPGTHCANLRDATAHLSVPAQHQQIAFTFTAPGLTTMRSVNFKYRLEGLDKTWVDAGTSRTAYYTHLPPGSYRFHVIGCNRDGVWNESGASVGLTAEPRFWQTALFRVACGAGGCGVIAGCVLLVARRRYRTKLERLERQRLLERERARIAQDLHDDLGAGLAEISFSSELSQDPSLSAQEAREHGSEIQARAREMVTSLDEIVWAVNPRHDTVSSLVTYCCQFAQRFLETSRVRCSLEVAKDLPEAPLSSEQRHNLFLAFKEALLNAVKHSGATQIRIIIAAEGADLNVTIADNGNGFEPAVNARNGGDGIGNMRRRMEKLGGECDIRSGRTAGSRVSLRLPLALPSTNGHPKTAHSSFGTS